MYPRKVTFKVKRTIIKTHVFLNTVKLIFLWYHIVLKRINFASSYFTQILHAYAAGYLLKINKQEKWAMPITTKNIFNLFEYIFKRWRFTNLSACWSWGGRWCYCQCLTCSKRTPGYCRCSVCSRISPQPCLDPPKSKWHDGQRQINEAGKCIRENTALRTKFRGDVRVQACHAAVWIEFVFLAASAWLPLRRPNWCRWETAFWLASARVG